MTPPRLAWDAAFGREALDAALSAAGIAWLRAPELAEAAEREPWALCERLLGERPMLLERQPIRAVPGGRSFASGRMAAPLHSDSQTFLGVPPHVQVMACRSAAAAGGEGHYLDTWGLLKRIERERPELLARLFETPRRFPFVFGDVFGPTVSLRGGSLVFTHSPRPPSDDDFARELQPFLDSSPLVVVKAEPGDLVLIHNHRLLHGRSAFLDERRSFTRLLVWRRQPWPAPERWRARAEACAQASAERLRSAPAAVQEAYGVAPPTPAETLRRASVVLELLRGVPAGVLSAREGVAEPELYRWRDAFLKGAATGLAAADAASPDAAPAAWLDRLS